MPVFQKRRQLAKRSLNDLGFSIWRWRWKGLGHSLNILKIQTDWSIFTWSKMAKTVKSRFFDRFFVITRLFLKNFIQLINIKIKVLTQGTCHKKFRSIEPFQSNLTIIGNFGKSDLTLSHYHIVNFDVSEKFTKYILKTMVRTFQNSART